MKKVLKLTRLLFIAFCISFSASAHAGDLKLGKHLVFYGAFEGKEPNGIGALKVKKDDNIILRGTFSVLKTKNPKENVLYYSVSDATLELGDVHITGNVYVFINTDKKAKQIVDIRIRKGSILTIDKVRVTFLDDSNSSGVYYSDSRYQYYFESKGRFSRDERARTVYYSNVNVHSKLMFNSDLNSTQKMDSIKYSWGGKLYPNYKYGSKLMKKYQASPNVFYVGEFNMYAPDIKDAVFMSKKTKDVEYSGSFYDPNSIWEDGHTTYSSASQGSGTFLKGNVKFPNGDTFSGIFRISDSDKISYIEGTQTINSNKVNWKDGVNQTALYQERKEWKERITSQIRNGSVDPIPSRLLRKSYSAKEKENVAIGGRACWLYTITTLTFNADKTMTTRKSLVANLIAANGGDGQNVYKKDLQTKRTNFCLIRGTIYQWTGDDVEGFENPFNYDSTNDVIKGPDSMIYYP